MMPAAEVADRGADTGLQARALWSLLKPVESALLDPTVTEVMVNGHAEVRLERSGRIVASDLAFASHEDLLSAVRNVAQYVGRRVTADTARFDARLPDGSRVHVVMPPASRQGICMTIRKFRRSYLTLDTLVANGSLTAEAREFIELCVLAERNLAVSGGT